MSHWQTIETAPPGKLVYLYNRQYQEWAGKEVNGIVMGWYDPGDADNSSRVYDQFGVECHWDVSHWHPIPGPPLQDNNWEPLTTLPLAKFVQLYSAELRLERSNIYETGVHIGYGTPLDPRTLIPADGRRGTIPTAFFVMGCELHWNYRPDTIIQVPEKFLPEFRQDVEKALRHWKSLKEA